jgi:putative hydrolase of the HAD superfamily
LIKAISFDFYNTLVRFWPPLNEIQQAACREFGVQVAKEELDRGYSVADVYFNQENATRPLCSRTVEERSEFFARYEQIILGNAAIPVSLNFAKQIWGMAMSVPKDFIAFDDVIPSLSTLRTSGYRLGLLSNLQLDLVPLCERLGLTPHLDFIVNAAEVGSEKPHTPIFLTGLQRINVAPEEMVHVGDQYESDVLGARAVGINQVLIDREGWHPQVTDCPKIGGLPELHRLLTDAPQYLKSTGIKL